MVEHPGADELRDRVDEPRAAQADGRDVADDRQLDLAVDDLHALDRAVRGAHAAADLRRLERGPGRRGGRERPRGGAEHDLRVRADVDEEAHAAVERDARRKDAGDDVGADVRAERRERDGGRAPVDVDAEVGRRRIRHAPRRRSVKGAIDSGSGSMPSAIWIIVWLPVDDDLVDLAPDRRPPRRTPRR